MTGFVQGEAADVGECLQRLLNKITIILGSFSKACVTLSKVVSTESDHLTDGILFIQRYSQVFIEHDD